MSLSRGVPRPLLALDHPLAPSLLIDLKAAGPGVTLEGLKNLKATLARNSPHPLSEPMGIEAAKAITGITKNPYSPAPKPAGPSCPACGNPMAKNVIYLCSPCWWKLTTKDRMVIGAMHRKRLCVKTKLAQVVVKLRALCPTQSSPPSSSP